MLGLRSLARQPLSRFRLVQDSSIRDEFEFLANTCFAPPGGKSGWPLNSTPSRLRFCLFGSDNTNGDLGESRAGVVANSSSRSPGPRFATCWRLSKKGMLLSCWVMSNHVLL